MVYFLFAFLSFFPFLVAASSGEDLFSPISLAWGSPFVLVLLSLALGPLVFPRFWHHHYGKLMGLFSLGFLVPSSTIFGFEVTIHQILHTFLSEYIPFILLIGSLFVVTGGIRLKAQWSGTPKGNCAILAAGTLAASFIGTTGASMLLIRPLIRANAWREHTKHLYIFFIFLVSNIGGCLTPLGDPPLFLGFLQGVPFFWTFTQMALPLFVLGGTLLGIFYILDRRAYQRESRPAPHLKTSDDDVTIEGFHNIFLLGGVLIAVLGSGLWASETSLWVAGIPLKLENILRDVVLLGITLLSYFTTRPELRHANHFSWDPLLEVIKIFFGIFITVIPVLALLQVGPEGPLGSFMAAVNSGGIPHAPSYFWLTGLFSSFLDNAPTYFVFFHMAGGDVTVLTTALSKILLAISMGAVFMGAMTYIGNAPNFMVRSIAEGHGVKMPHFFGYMAWSCLVLLPLFLGMVWIFLG